MYFDLGDYRPDITPVGSAISWRDGMMLSLVFHFVFVIAVLFGPELPRSTAVARRLEPVQLGRAREAERHFVFVQPRLDLPAPTPPDRAPLSDLDRRAQSPKRARRPSNTLPYSEGNSPERVDLEGRRASRQGVSDAQRSDRTPPAEAGSGRGAKLQQVPQLPGNGDYPVPQKSSDVATDPEVSKGTGSLGEALRNIERYVGPERFENRQGGGGDSGAWIQFDTKGVEFGPWIRRFRAHVIRNWFIPYAAMALKGHVVLTFFVHRDGAITDVQVLRPSEVEAFTRSALNAILRSNPTQPLPAEYPSENAFFTVTFYFNEYPPIQ
ncbi:MAG: TonB family protein [Acidimicrobiia bacterium]